VADVGVGVSPATIARVGFQLVRGLNRAADDSLNREQTERFVAAGGEIRGPDPNRPTSRSNPVGYYYQGQRISEDRARRIQREYRILSETPAMPPGQWEDMVSPDQGMIGAPALPAVPGFIAPLVGWAMRQAGLPIAATLFWPTAAGPGSDLRDLYAVPAPRPVPGRRPGRRSQGRTVRPRRRRVVVSPVPVRTPAGVQPRPRGRARTRPVAQPGVSPLAIPNIKRNYPIKIPPPKIDLPRPAPIPRTVGQRAAAIARTPLGQAAQRALLGAALAYISAPGSRSAGRVSAPATPAAPGTLPGLGTITLPGQSFNPVAQPNLALQPLTSYQYAVAQSPAQSLDEQCRARARQQRKKRKKPKDRTVCYRGTFIEGKKRTRKSRKEKIPCR